MAITAPSLCKWSLILICAAWVAGCRPLPHYIERPEGPPDYQLGWQDGCDSKLSQTPGFYKMVYGFKKRPELIGNDLYNQGWSNGFFYCAWPEKD